jgi:hypothetical protein
VERFAEEMDTLLEITLRSNLVEKLSMALYDCLFEEEDQEGGSGSGGESKVCVRVYDIAFLSYCESVLYSWYWSPTSPLVTTPFDLFTLP